MTRSLFQQLFHKKPISANILPLSFKVSPNKHTFKHRVLHSSSRILTQKPRQCKKKILETNNKMRYKIDEKTKKERPKITKQRKLMEQNRTPPKEKDLSEGVLCFL